MLWIVWEAPETTDRIFAYNEGLSVSFVGHIERGTRKPSVDTIIAICKALNISSDYVLGLDGEEESKQ